MSKDVVFQRGADKSNERLIEEDEAAAREAARDPDDAGLGRPEHVPTDAMRAAVTLLASFRIGQAKIAACVGVGEKALRRHYRDELNNAEVRVDLEVLTAWLKNVRAGKEMTILSYMNSKHLNPATFFEPPPPPTDEKEVTAERVRQIAQQINEEF